MNKFSIKNIARMDDQEVHAIFEFLRFGGPPRCTKCGCPKLYSLGARRKWRCAAPVCKNEFSVTSDTIFSSRKMSYRDILLAAFAFVAASQGCSSLNFSRLLGIEQKTAYLTAMKFRSVLLAESGTNKLCGTVEIDGGIFGGHRRFESSVRPMFNKRIRKARMAERRCIVIAKQRMGRTRFFVGKKESDALAFLKDIIEPGSTIQVDGARAWDSLAELGEMLRTEHLYTFGSNSQHTNNAESFFSGFRRMHRGVHHQMDGDNMKYYAAELAWKRDFRDTPLDEKVIMFLRECLRFTSPCGAEVN